MKSRVLLLLTLTATVAACGKPAQPGAIAADDLKVEMKLVDERGAGESIGSVKLSDTGDGLRITPDLKNLPQGPHGFHVHQNADCGTADKDGKMTAGEAAGEHYDPSGSGTHAGPGGMGHAGDLPRLIVAPDGKATTAMTVAKLKIADLKNRTLMIHAGNDDYAASPGGARFACGVVS